MNATLYIIVDVSGSMNEMGKIHLQRNMCRYAAQLQLIDPEKYSCSDIRFYQWGQNISEIVLQSSGDIPALNAEGSSSPSVLFDFLSRNLNDIGKSKVLILSDGKFPDIVSFQNQLGTFPDLIVRTVAVGADADLLKLRKISTNNTVYLSENIAPAIDSAIFGSDEPLAEPVSTAQIVQSESTVSEETEEDWDA